MKIAIVYASSFLTFSSKNQVITQINVKYSTVYLDTLMYPEAIASHIISWKKGIINVYGVDAAGSRQTRYK